MNELLFLTFFFGGASLVLLAAKMGKEFLFALVALLSILMNIFVVKPFEIFGFAVYGGNEIYGLIFLATDLLAENFGKKEARRAVEIGICSLLIYFFAATFFVKIAPNLSAQNGAEIQTSFENIFAPAWQIVVASIAAFSISNFFDVEFFHFLKNKTAGKFLWLRSNLSTFVSQTIDTFIFTTLASVFGIFSWEFFWGIVIFNLIFKIIIALLDTPFLYLSKIVLRKKAVWFFQKVFWIPQNDKVHRVKIGEICGRIFDFLFPPRCVSCGREDFFVCEKCVSQIQILAKPFREKEIAQIYPLTFWNDKIIKKCIRKIKFRFAARIVDNLQPFFSRALREIPLPENAIFVPVPLHFLRQNFRGFNQSEILAKSFAEILNRPVLKILKRTKNTRPQTLVDPRARVENLQNAFRIHQKIAEGISLEMPIFLVDDVATTAATLNECGKTLRAAGFSKINAIVLATGRKV